MLAKGKKYYQKHFTLPLGLQCKTTESVDCNYIQLYCIDSILVEGNQINAVRHPITIIESALAFARPDEGLTR